MKVQFSKKAKSLGVKDGFLVLEFEDGSGIISVRADSLDEETLKRVIDVSLVDLFFVSRKEADEMIYKSGIRILNQILRGEI